MERRFVDNSTGCTECSNNECVTALDSSVERRHSGVSTWIGVDIGSCLDQEIHGVNVPASGREKERGRTSFVASKNGGACFQEGGRDKRVSFLGSHVEGSQALLVGHVHICVVGEEGGDDGRVLVVDSNVKGSPALFAGHVGVCAMGQKEVYNGRVTLFHSEIEWGVPGSGGAIGG